MRGLLRNIIVLSAVSVCLATKAQDEGGDEDYFHLIRPKHSYTLDILLPTATSNQSFRRLTQGIVRLGASYQFSLKSGFYLGLGYNWAYFRIDKFKTPSFVIGGAGVQTAFGKLGYEHFYSERVGMEYSCKIGYSLFTFSTDSLTARTGGNGTGEGLFIEPSAAFILTSSGSTACKWFLAYAIQGFAFDPTRFGLYNSMGFDANRYKNPLQYISFGFCVTHYFKQR